MQALAKVSAKHSSASAKHSSESSVHMTPAYVVEAARETLGGIDLDPATSRLANELVRAPKIFTELEDGLRQKWPGRVLLNAPGGALRRALSVASLGGTKSSQVLWWQKLFHEWEDSRVTAGIFIGFSIEFLQSAQACTARARPTRFPLCVPECRIPFDKEEHGVRVGSKQPSHANVIVCVTDDRACVGRFKEVFGHLGEVFNLDGIR